jgi:hypothetical protein
VKFRNSNGGVYNMAYQGKLNYYQYIRQLNFVAAIKELFSFLDPYAEIEANKIGSSRFSENTDRDGSTAKIQDAIIRAESEEGEILAEEEW